MTPADDATDGVSRRSFVKVLGASVALAGLDGCSRMPAEQILPYVHAPEDVVPGRPSYFATTMVVDGFGTGVLAESHEGRPTKIEGNPDHPASLGAAGVLEQASVLQLYDPDRARDVRGPGGVRGWDAFVAQFAPSALRPRVGARGAGLRLLLEPTASPLVAELLDRVRTIYPDAGVHFHAPFAAHNASRALDAGGTPVLPQFDVTRAAVILALDADFLGTMPFHLRYARAFADGRRLPTPAAAMNRLYVAECALSVTGGAADHRIAVAPSAMAPLARALAARVGGGEGSVTVGVPVPEAPIPGVTAAWVEAVASDLRANAGRSVVLAGPQAPVELHALVDSINTALGNIGRTVWYTDDPRLGARDPASGLLPLADAMGARVVSTVLCLGGNPVYASPEELAFARLLRTVPESVYVGLYDDETAHACRWLVPAAHYLESWGDARAYDGTVSLIQPLVQPLFGGRSVVEVLAVLAGEPAAPYDLLRARWQRMGGATGGGASESWERLLQRGVQEGSGSAPVAARARAELLAAMPAMPSEAGPAPAPAPARAPGPDHVELVIAPDPKIRDGSYANNAWLQELPEPITKLTWDNAAEIAPATAAALGLESGDVVELAARGDTMRVPLLVVPGHATGAVTVRAGYGRTGEEQVARGVGVNAFALWSRAALATGAFTTPGATVRRAPDGGHHAFAITQREWDMHGRNAARATTLAAYRARPESVGDRSGRVLSLFPPHVAAPDTTSGQQWAMTIDLGTCIGCGGCVVACQAENNTPVVGKEDVERGREMHWLRIDRYHAEAPGTTPGVVMQPMLCQHCEKAPCEYVCPVEATVHSPDGLNEMVYNRCVGTRFCSNNCPYKVRRFNWFDYNKELEETEMMVKNPDVTVRERGVMEKCTFCVQRIREAEIGAAREGRPLRGSEVRTACQQACPTQAIVFGSLAEPESEMVRRRAEPRSYAALGELGTEPRVRYLAAVRNPNPALSATVERSTAEDEG